MPLTNDRASWYEEIEDRTVTVELSLELIDRLAAEVLRGFGAVPRRGVEVGGVLLGHSDGARLQITDYELLACEYSQGPTYVLTGGDRERFLEAVRVRRPVAVFRSHTREELSACEEDVRLLEEAGLSVLLLAKPAALAASTAALYLREGCETKPIGSPFALRARQLTGRPVQDREPRRHRHEMNPLRPAAEPPAEIPPPAFLSVPAAKRTQVTRRALWGVALGAVFALGAAAGWFAAATRATTVKAAPTADPLRLRLSAEQSGKGVLVRWDRTAPAVRQGKRGVLTIREGQGSQTVELDLKQLRSGNVLYRHLPAEVSFELEVYVDGSRVAEEVVWRAR